MRLLAIIAGAILATAPALRAQNCASLTGGVVYTQNFDTLASTGTSSVMPQGWLFSESGTNADATYAAGTGSGNAGNTYSFGTTTGDRALGTLQSGTLIPTIGACFTNNTGGVITQLNIAYTGEQYRLGATGRQDSLRFQYSVDATSLTTGAWTPVAELDFNGPVTAGTVGQVNPPQTAAVSASITGLNIAAGTTFYVRWNDFNASGSDDGLAVDDFTLSAGTAAGISINDVTQVEGNAGTTVFAFTVSLSSPAPEGGVTFDIATADGTALAGEDYVAKTLTAQTIPEGQSAYTFEVAVVGDTLYEPDETFSVIITNVNGADVADAEGLGTIVNDDVKPVIVVPIHEIQSAAERSPYAGEEVTTEGVITAVKYNGYFIQTPTGKEDSDPATSEGLFVFTNTFPGGAAPAGIAVSNLVRVTGTVAEFASSSDPQAPLLTELTNSTFSVISKGLRLPRPVVLTTANLNPAGAFDQLERYEGMRVQVNSLDVIAPTGGNVNASTATATTNGIFYGVISGTARPFREIGMERPETIAGAPAGIPVFDANPERLRVDSDALLGSPAIDVAAGMVVKNLVGPLDYGDRTYTILPDRTTTPVVSGTVTAQPVPVVPAGQFTVATSNLERFFNDVDDPGGDTVISTAGYQRRLNKASLMIRNTLRLPDIVAVEEVENVNTLQDLADKINSDVAQSGGTSPQYTAYVEPGNDIGLINVGFLVKSARVTVLSVTQEGKSTMYTPPGGSSAILNDRPPLVLKAAVQREGGAPFNITVIANHLRSLLDLNNPVETLRIATKRRAQAEFLANLIQQTQAADPNERIVVLGDFNAYQFNDGYVDVVGTVMGTPTGAEQVFLASPDLVEPNLFDAASTVPAGQRYSYLFQGNAQTIDQVLITQNLVPYLAGFAYGRVNAEFPQVVRSDENRPERISDHDPAVVYFRFE